MYSRVGQHVLRRSFPDSGNIQTSSHNQGSYLLSSANSEFALIKKDYGYQVLSASPHQGGDVVPEETPSNRSSRIKIELGIGLAIAIPIFLAVLLLAWLWYKRCYLRVPNCEAPGLPGRSVPEGEIMKSCTSYSNESKIQLLGSWLRSCSTNSFSRPRRRAVRLPCAYEMQYSELQAATNNFSGANLLGEGGSSRVFKAKLDGDTYGAVKSLEDNRECGDTSSVFQSEVDLMRQVRHPNLVSLIGYCTRGDQRLLVYELMENGSLEDQLYGPTKGSKLVWNLRIKIALETARGLEYLHEHCVPPVVHRDLKASNILLDANFNAKISDFGLATPLEGLTRAESLKLVGTIGYVAPEFFDSGTLTERSDVYAFGVVLLELLTGRKPVDHSLPYDEQSLVNWAKPQLSDRRKLPHFVAPCLRAHLNLKHLYQVAAVAALCVCEEPNYRPLVADVVNSLVPLVPIQLGGTLRPMHVHAAESRDQLTLSKSRSHSFEQRGADDSV